LRRRNFPPETLSTLDKVYRLIYDSGLNVTQALQRISSEFTMTDEVKHVVEFIERSKRGIIWSRR
jgi:UDP-N-acetylglucosamine acyltransferase